MRLFTPALTWGGWTHNPQELGPGSLGILEFAKDTANGGIVSELVPIEAGGLYRFGLLLGDEGDPHAVGLNLRVLDDKGEWIGQTRALPGARTDFDCFVPHRTYGVRLAVVAATPKTGARVAVLNLTVDRIDPADYYRLERDSRSVPVIAAMASIPSRRQMLRDAVESLLLQCDLVRVFLNEYPDVPEFLDHARIQVRRSQDWDDKGDAGKFGWIDAQDEPGYRIAADDDLIFPPDFARRMIRVLERHANRAIAAAHGVYVKQPFAHYYDRESRSVIYFQEALERERSVHILGTNALMYHSVFVKMTWDDFMFRNMADIFLARYAQKNRIPMICADRPRLWVRQNTQEGGFESIYESSRLRNRSKFDSSLVQDGVLKHIAPLTVQATMRRKAAICLLATDPAAVDALLASWARSRSTETDWVLIAARRHGGSGAARARGRNPRADRTSHHIGRRPDAGGARVRRAVAGGETRGRLRLLGARLRAFHVGCLGRPCRRRAASHQADGNFRTCRRRGSAKPASKGFAGNPAGVLFIRPRRARARFACPAARTRRRGRRCVLCARASRFAARRHRSPGNRPMRLRRVCGSKPRRRHSRSSRRLTRSRGGGPRIGRRPRRAARSIDCSNAST